MAQNRPGAKLDPFEMVFLVLLGVGIGWVAFRLSGLPREATLFPKVVLGFAIVAWVGYVADRLWLGVRNIRGQGQILDVGFFGQSDVARRTLTFRILKFWGSVGGLILGIWIVGFHIAVPVFVGVYLIVFARVKPWWALIAAVPYFLALVFIYDRFLYVAWNEPLLTQIFGIPLQPPQR